MGEIERGLMLQRGHRARARTAGDIMDTCRVIRTRKPKSNQAQNPRTKVYHVVKVESSPRRKCEKSEIRGEQQANNKVSNDRSTEVLGSWKMRNKEPRLEGVVELIAVAMEEQGRQSLDPRTRRLGRTLKGVGVSKPSQSSRF